MPVGVFCSSLKRCKASAHSCEHKRRKREKERKKREGERKEEELNKRREANFYSFSVCLLLAVNCKTYLEQYTIFRC